MLSAETLGKKKKGKKNKEKKSKILDLASMLLESISWEFVTQIELGVEAKMGAGEQAGTTVPGRFFYLEHSLQVK